MKKGDSILASQLSGDFVLPRDASKKLAFIAGGIGVTPFRSMIKYMSDTHDMRAATLFYAGRSVDDLMYMDVFEDARQKIGVDTVYTVDATGVVPTSWDGRVGRIDAAMIREVMPDYKERLFYISGSYMLVSGMKKVLQELGITSANIKVDYFPGII